MATIGTKNEVVLFILLICMRKRVEGLTLDLTRYVEGCDWRDLIVEEEINNACTECSLHTSIRQWKGNPICKSCHEKHKVDIPVELIHKIDKIYNNPCTFCGITGVKMHLDHINMFSKVYSVGHMAGAGYTEEEIMREREKCQLLCLKCHAKVTRHERKLGFISKKIALSKKIKRGEDITALRDGLFKEYEEAMGPIYEKLRGSGVA